MDFKGPIKLSNQLSFYILLVVDKFSKFLWTKIFETKDCEPVAIYIRNLMLIEGTPTRLVSDNGGEFVNEAMHSVLAEFIKEGSQDPGIQFVHPRPNHPEANGQAERTIRTYYNQFQNYIYKKEISTLETIIQSNKLQTHAYNVTSKFVCLHKHHNDIHVEHSTINAIPHFVRKGYLPATLLFEHEDNWENEEHLSKNMENLINEQIEKWEKTQVT